ncbi:hypothetical protein M433DRAFT_155384 [Acidomyces richmondensis BFW]|nr:MAG: hypothetical protein FE78DRAFT_94530 [Acidomyces sp. 'richmondensis']KYG44663.1 hypothetical protein M433DRAFT_155384 [Acidomyces richmondensis BFW]
MKINARHAISTSKLVLVPYSSHHVPMYHAWMQDPDLQAATASEPLSLEQEYAMQRSWREDRDKLTFIICHPLTERSVDAGEGKIIRPAIDDGPERMIGDVNLFLFPMGNEELSHMNGCGGETQVDAYATANFGVIGELELMIAYPKLRRQGFGRTALQIFLSYIVAKWPQILAEFFRRNIPEAASDSSLPGLHYLRVKIQESNVGSIKLFESLDFERMGNRTNYFGEVELRWLPSAAKAYENVWRECEMLQYEGDPNMCPRS